MALFIPFGVIAFLINSAVQSLRSGRRIRLHERGLAGIQPGNYRVPLLITGMREAVEDVYENLNSAQSHEYLVAGTEEETLQEPDSPMRERTIKEWPVTQSEVASNEGIEHPLHPNKIKLTPTAHCHRYIVV